MVEIEQDYDFCKVEERWERRWAEEKPWQFDVQDVGARLAAPDQKKFYNLVEFPYPSGEGLHVGHVYTFSGADCYSRYRRMRGARVFQPMGFDSFGIHTENYALKVGEHPMQLTAKTIANYQRQLNRIGAIWNWEHQVVTSDPSYYKWTQWIFLQLFKAGLAVQKVAPVVWCPSCLTVLANEQLEGDRCERCDSIVEQREMKQWFFKITDYAEKLLAGLEEIDWPELSKNLQREWIGRSEATEIDFTIEDSEEKLTVFTTRPDTLFGATFVVLAPDHPQLPALIAGQPEASKIHAFAERLKARAANSESSTEQRGVFTGRRTINPANGKAIPIYLADYVVSGYGTGAVMAVPAHDSRDYDFAKLMNLPIVQVIESEEAQGDGAWIGEGQLVNSGDFTGMESAEARPKITRWLSETGRGRSAVYYRLRDWLISRQRYWGPPIPIIHCDRCGAVPVPEEDLPVLLPEVENFRPTGTGLSPLASVESFVQTTCPQCDAPARRETDVSDTFVDSAWYFLRYPSSDIQDRPWDPERTERLLPVDLYAGGKEHIVRHHLYARFITRALHDLGHLPFSEPFPKLLLHGLLIKDGAKMSKSRGNVVNPDDYLDRVGVDNLRMYLLFCGDWQEGGDFSDKGLKGILRFTQRLWRLLAEAPAKSGVGGVELSEVDRGIERIGRDLERLKFNTAIARLMELTRWAGEHQVDMSDSEWQRVARTLTLLLAPFAPFMAEELWSRLGGEYSVHVQPWPKVDAQALRVESFSLVVQVNGRVRDRLTAAAGLERAEAMELALSSEKVRGYLAGKTPREMIYVPDRLVNLVV